MAFKKVYDRLNKQQAERVFLEAQRALLTPQRGGAALIAMYVLSSVILLLPLCFLGLGIWVIVANWFNIPTLIIGVILIALAYFLAPRPARNDQKTFRRADLPELYRLVDAISAEIGTAPPDGIHLTDEMNAYAGRYGYTRRVRILGIGIPLWRVESPQERIATLAHEMAHFVNGDPARGVVAGAALHTVSLWEYFLAPNMFYDGDHRDFTEVLAELIQMVFRLPITLLGYALLYLHFNRSQRAEYLADGLAARVSGHEAILSAWHRTHLYPLAGNSIQTLYPYNKDQNARIFDVMADAVLNPDPDEKAALEEKGAAEKHRVDNSHPPTIYRMGFIMALGDLPPRVLAADFDFDKIDAELAVEADRLGKRLMQMYEDTTM